MPTDNLMQERLAPPSQTASNVFFEFLKSDLPIVSLEKMLSGIPQSDKTILINIPRDELTTDYFPTLVAAYGEGLHQNQYLQAEANIYFGYEVIQDMELIVLTLDIPSRGKFRMGKIVEKGNSSYMVTGGKEWYPSTNPDFWGITVIEAFEKDMRTIVPRYFEKVR